MTLTAKSLHLLSLALLMASVSGCRHPVERKLEGRWLGDSVENFADQHIAPATGWVKGTSFEFAGSTLTVTIPADEPRAGKFRVASVRERDIRLEIERPDGAKDTVELTLDDEHSMRWMLSNGRAVQMRREL